MQPIEMTAHEIERIGPKLAWKTHDFRWRQLAAGIDISIVPGGAVRVYAVFVGSQAEAC